MESLWQLRTDFQNQEDEGSSTSIQREGVLALELSLWNNTGSAYEARLSENFTVSGLGIDVEDMSDG
jgi:hypothetical protein